MAEEALEMSAKEACICFKMFCLFMYSKSELIQRHKASDQIKNVYSVTITNI